MCNNPGALKGGKEKSAPMYMLFCRTQTSSLKGIPCHIYDMDIK